MRIGSPLPTQHRAESIIAVFGEQMATQTQVATSLLVYYFLPGLYCNVSGIHLIPQRNRRLWVIAAGVYSMMIGTLAFLAWSALAPETLLADIALAFAIGSLVDVIFNATRKVAKSRQPSGFLAFAGLNSLPCLLLYAPLPTRLSPVLNPRPLTPMHPLKTSLAHLADQL